MFQRNSKVLRICSILFLKKIKFLICAVKKYCAGLNILEYFNVLDESRTFSAIYIYTGARILCQDGPSSSYSERNISLKIFFFTLEEAFRQLMYMYLVKMSKVATINIKQILTYVIVKMYHFLKKQNSTLQQS